MNIGKVNLSPDIWKNILPTTPVVPNNTIWDNFPQKDIITGLLPQIQALKLNWIQLKLSMMNGEKIEDPVLANEYAQYLDYPSKEIANLAARIVDPNDSDDVKAYKILSWVQDNLKYVSDRVNYGMNEYWTTPMETLKKMSGDCEDGAFLIHSLMLNAGIPWERIRTYGGDVYAGVGASTGGHGWTAYQRETDNEWVVLDWCYYPNTKEISERTPMKDDMKYVDDWFYINEYSTVETPYANKVRNPAMAYSSVKTMKFVEGQRVSLTA